MQPTMQAAVLTAHRLTAAATSLLRACLVVLLTSWPLVVTAEAQSGAGEQSSTWNEDGTRWRTGVLDRVEVERRTIIVSGQRYALAPSVTVRVAGRPGAVSLLEPGMKLQLLVRPPPSGQGGEVLAISQIPPNVPIEET